MPCASSTATPKTDARLFLFRLLGIGIELAAEARPEGFRVLPGESFRQALARNEAIDRDNNSGLFRAAALKWVHDMLALALAVAGALSIAIPIWYLHR